MFRWYLVTLQFQTGCCSLDPLLVSGLPLIDVSAAKDVSVHDGGVFTRVLRIELQVVRWQLQVFLQAVVLGDRERERPIRKRRAVSGQA